MVTSTFPPKILNKLISGSNHFKRNHMLYWMNRSPGVEVLCEMCLIVKLRLATAAE